METAYQNRYRTPDGRLVAGWVLMVSLFVLDVVTTTWGLGAGLGEANPVVARIMAYDSSGAWFFIVKMASLPVLFLLIRASGRILGEWVEKTAILAINTVLLAVVLTNLIHLAGVAA